MVIDENNTVIPGLYAAGEVACVSVHGANRLGTNSLLDLIVFGKHAGLNAAEYANGASFQPLARGRRRFYPRSSWTICSIAKAKKKRRISRSEMKSVMFDDVGVFRTEEGMQEALNKIRELKERFQHVRVDDRGKIYNTNLIYTWELKQFIGSGGSDHRLRSGTQGKSRRTCPRRLTPNGMMSIG